MNKKTALTIAETMLFALNYSFTISKNKQGFHIVEPKSSCEFNQKMAFAEVGNGFIFLSVDYAGKYEINIRKLVEKTKEQYKFSTFNNSCITTEMDAGIAIAQIVAGQGEWI